MLSFLNLYNSLKSITNAHTEKMVSTVQSKSLTQHAKASFSISLQCQNCYTTILDCLSLQLKTSRLEKSRNVVTVLHYRLVARTQAIKENPIQLLDIANLAEA